MHSFRRVGDAVFVENDSGFDLGREDHLNVELSSRDKIEKLGCTPQWVRMLMPTTLNFATPAVCVTPLFSSIVLSTFYVTDSQPGSNPYGPNPKDTLAA